MLYINGKPISKADLENLNKELREGTEVVAKIIINDNGNVMIYLKDYLES